jgi:hypothetical protein
LKVCVIEINLYDNKLFSFPLELDAFMHKHMNNDDAQVPQLPDESAAQLAAN